jgi:hypothetical protein
LAEVCPANGIRYEMQAMIKFSHAELSCATNST